MTAADILRECLNSNTEAAWKLFVERFQPLISASVARVVRRYQVPVATLIDDLTQETYLRLCKDECRALRNFNARHDEAIFGYIKVIATTVALDHFRARFTQKRGNEISEGETASEGTVSPSAIEKNALIQQIDILLAATESERDRAIFWLYYGQGYTARDIAAMPHLGLSEKGVESCIYRLTRSLKDMVVGGAARISGSAKGKSQPGTLGVIA
ncbi:MAG: sigma-70 family RNA polymerase sigma factor [Terracidiphilus sp.]|jgi:RNA polymerase sigma-70 factor (ECF subfamily)